METKGYVQVYTGHGKAKTTAGIGLALRAAGAGLKVFIAQFLKEVDSPEIKALSRFDNIHVKQYGNGKSVKKDPPAHEKAAARKGYRKLCDILMSREYDLVIAEEGNSAYRYNLISEKELLALTKMKPENVELVITGRGAPESLIQRADLVTEMREVKHGCLEGVTACVGGKK